MTTRDASDDQARDESATADARDDTGNVADRRVIAQTRRWIESFVVDLNLCPFARRELDAQKVRFAVTRVHREEQLLTALHGEMRRLLGDDSIATSFLIHPGALNDFLSYNDFLGGVDRLLEMENLEGVLQVASFHPQYLFAGTAADDAENFSNRSPWPMLHLLREDSVSAAVARHPDAEGIPDRNIETLRQLGSAALLARWRACLAGGQADGQTEP